MALCYHFSLDLTTACIVARLAKEGTLGPIDRENAVARSQSRSKVMQKSLDKSPLFWYTVGQALACIWIRQPHTEYL